MGVMAELAAAADETARFGIGGNGPPEPSPYEAFKGHIDDLLVEAQGQLDGDPILSEAQAEGVAKLLDMLRQTRKDADAARAAEKKPHDDAGKEVQSRWKPLLDRADIASDTAKKALAPYLAIKDAEKRAAAEKAAQEAAEKAAAARAAIEAARADDLAAREHAESLIKEAEKAAKVAARADKDKAMVAGGARAVSLRSVWTPTLIDPVAALKHYRERQPEELKAWLLDQAAADVRAGSRSIPGFTVEETRIAQ